jgi:ribosomal protein S18 acetylase RimI-like enzyme
VYRFVVAVLLWTAEKLLQEVEIVPCSLVGSGEFPQTYAFDKMSLNNSVNKQHAHFHMWNLKVYHSYKKRSGLQKYLYLFALGQYISRLHLNALRVLYKTRYSL